MSYLEQSRAAGRDIFPDLVRALALIGIALVNVGIIAWPMMQGYMAGGLETSADHGAHFAINALFLMKSYTLFSFMFGVGFAYQMVSAEKRAVGFAGRYWRRIIGLLVLGLLHIAFLFQGDILVSYAILGSLLFLFRKTSTKTLIGWAISVYVAQMLIIAFFAAMVWMGNAYAPEEMATEIARMEDAAKTSLAVYGNGSFAQAVALRLSEWSEGIPFIMLMQGLGVFSFFLFGLAAVRSDVIANPGAPIWKRARHLALPIGLVISAAGAWLINVADSMMDTGMMLGMFLISLGSPFSSAGYLGLIAKWAEAGNGPIKTFLARGGTATLTAYLMQGLIMSVIFNNYGLGLFGKLGAAQCILIALGTALFTIAFASLWRIAFARGPMEYLLRGWTYLGAR